MKTVRFLSIATREKTAGQVLAAGWLVLLGIGLCFLSAFFAVIYWAILLFFTFRGTRRYIEVNGRGVLLRFEIDRQFLPFETIAEVTKQKHHLTFQYRLGGGRVVGPLPAKEIDDLHACIERERKRYRPVRLSADDILRGDAFRMPDETRLRDAIEENEVEIEREADDRAAAQNRE